MGITFRLELSSAGTAALQETYGNRLASLLANAAARDHGISYIAAARSADRPVDRILAMALEVPDRSSRSAAHRAAPDGAGVLRAGSAWTAQPDGTLVDCPYWPYFGVHIQRAGDWLDPL